MAMTGYNFRTHSTSILTADDAQICTIGNIVFVLMVDTRALSMVRRPISGTSKNNEDECKSGTIEISGSAGGVIGVKFKKLAAAWTKIKHGVSFNRAAFPEKKGKSCLENGRRFF